MASSRFLLPVTISTVSLGIGSWLGIHYEKKNKCVATCDKVWNLPTANCAVSTTTKSPVAIGNVGEIMKYGYPSLTNLKKHGDFVLSYDRRNRIPNWVFEHLTAQKVAYNDVIDRENCQFFEDNDVHVYFRSTNADYYKSGYDRGHMAAAANHRTSIETMQQTFFLSNVAPQVGAGFNRDIWCDLEKYVRKLTKKYKNLYVCTGPLYLPRQERDGKQYVKYEVIGRNHVAVPTHFFKVILCETDKGEFDVESFVIPNAAQPEKAKLNLYRFSIESIERASGLLLFDKIPREFFRNINRIK
ncbi:endonuclease G, mitochondrial-like [Saccoglossus kowalevskii]|uniref:Endonuclease n=1 Tax=Saccoglossus kowalevskii TaxID=10224 RepID=A0ABM0GSC1_SACKO|nr:PREDICTED: endonuclease G, mitochondrial-like [Saccoglossus kowalevskii]